ncbi:hypothetical protein [Mammaliicoccus sciuri]|uniref:hypothetical protein n=1 Tax=Mammaliicoccus sciuri TaxID=1296 RepID=UPI00066A1B2E|nr:hypothetical protein [Mammaliicoccus sciuri]
MEFKAGDRVHVKRLDWEDVDFFATLEKTSKDGVLRLIDCSLKEYSRRAVLASHRGGFGNEDYYTLATDEEDTEEPVISYINDMYNEVPTPHQNDKDCKVCEPAHGRRYIRLRKLKSFITDHHLDYTLRVGKGYKGAKFRKHKLMLLDRGEVCAHVDINYCPMCGRKLKSSE